MRLLIAIAFLAATAAALESVQTAEPVTLPASATPVVVQKAEDSSAESVSNEAVKVASSEFLEANDALTVGPLKPVVLPVPTLTTSVLAEKPTIVSSNEEETPTVPTIIENQSVRVVDSAENTETTVETEITGETTNEVKIETTEAQSPKYTLKVVDLPPVPKADPGQVPIPIFQIADIRPAIVPHEVMRQVAELAAQTQTVVIADANPFAFYNPEPLNHLQAVNVVDSAVNKLDSQMDPIIVESGVYESLPLTNNIAVDSVKVVMAPERMYDAPLEFHSDQYFSIPLDQGKRPPPSRGPERDSAPQADLKGYRPIPQEFRRNMRPQQFRNVPHEFVVPRDFYNTQQDRKEQPMGFPEGFRPIPQEFRRQRQFEDVPQEFLRGPVMVDRAFYREPSQDWVVQPSSVPEGFRPIPQDYRRQAMPTRHPQAEVYLDPQFQPYPFRMNNPTDQ